MTDVKKPLVVRLVPVLDFGGVESRIALQASMAHGRPWRLRVCTFDADGAAAEAVRSHGVDVDVLGTPARLGSLQATARLLAYLRRVRPDIVHSSVIEANLHACAARLGYRAPLIVEEVGQPSHSRRARALLHLAYRAPSAIVGVSKVTCEYLVSEDGAPRSRTELIYNCASPQFFPDERRHHRRSADDLTRFISIGRLHFIKNHETLIRGFAQALNRGANALLTIVGTGPLEHKLRKIATEIAPGDRIRFLGFRSDVIDLLQESDAFVLPSHSEGCSISLVEAMATGVPAIGSRVPGIIEVVGDPHATRWTFSPSDPSEIASALIRFSELSTEEWEAIATRQQERAYANFSPTRYLSRLDELYDRVGSRRDASARNITKNGSSGTR